MRLLDKLERKIGWLAIPNLMFYIIVGNVLVYIMEMLFSLDMRSALAFDRQAILAGQVWRIISFVFIPPAAFSGSMWSMLMAALIFFFYYSIGRQLEYAMGTFAFTIYYLVGMLGVIVTGFAFGGSLTGTYLNSSLFFAYAFYFPNEMILFMFFIPIKIKYLAYFSGAMLTILLVLSSWMGRLVIVTGLFNFLLFFGKPLLLSRVESIDSYRRREKMRRAVGNEKSAGFRAKIYVVDPHKTGGPSGSVAKHCCEICGRTEQSNPELEFRYCSGCEGYHEYCMEHLHQHTHKQAGEA